MALMSRSAAYSKKNLGLIGEFSNQVFRYKFPIVVLEVQSILLNIEAKATFILFNISFLKRNKSYE